MMHTLVRISALVAMTHAALSLSAPAPAHACSFAFTEHFTSLDEVEVDRTPPDAPVPGEVVFHRRQPGGNSCSGTGTIGIHIDRAADDRTAQADMGYLIEITRGEQPDDIILPEGPVRADEDGTIWLPFADHDQEIDVTFSVRARDLGGNLGEPVEVQAFDDSQEPGAAGCSASGSTGSASLALVMLALAVGLRQRRCAFRE
jgi:MYXO-CTERM domain-containing protein